MDDFLKISTLLVEQGIDVIEVSGEQWHTYLQRERTDYKDAAMEFS